MSSADHHEGLEGHEGHEGHEDHEDHESHEYMLRGVFVVASFSCASMTVSPAAAVGLETAGRTAPDGVHAVHFRTAAVARHLLGVGGGGKSRRGKRAIGLTGRRTVGHRANYMARHVRV